MVLLLLKDGCNHCGSEIYVDGLVISASSEIFWRSLSSARAKKIKSEKLMSGCLLILHLENRPKFWFIFIRYFIEFYVCIIVSTTPSAQHFILYPLPEFHYLTFQQKKNPK